MRVFLNIIKWFFTVIGWLLLLILFLMAFPVRADILLEDAIFHLDVKYMFFRFKLLPSKKKANKERVEGQGGSSGSAHPDTASAAVDEKEDEIPDPPADGKEDKVPDLPADKQKKKSLSETLSRIESIVRRISQPGYWAVRMLLKAIHIRDVSVVVCVTGEDPASVGFRSGLQWSLIGEFMKTLNLIFGKNVTYGEVTVYPCFNGVEERKEKLSLSISTCPIIIVLIILGFGLGYLLELIKDLFSRGGKENVN